MRILLYFHLLGASVWIGGHLVLALGILPGALRRSDVQAIRNFEQVFEKIGLPALLLQVVTGLWLASLWLPHALWLGDSPQAALIQFHRLIRQEVGIPDNETLICGMSLGHADPDAPENALRTERAALAEWVAFRD